MTEKGKALIRKWEGCKLVAYLCPAGVPTIGYGNTTYADGTPVQLGDKIDLATANRLFDLILEKFEKQVRMLLGDTLCATLPKEAIDAVISLAYNIGCGNLSKSTVLKRIKADKLDFDGIENAWYMWNKAGGKVLQGLVNRRKDEYRMYKLAVLDQYSNLECYNIGKTGKP